MLKHSLTREVIVVFIVKAILVIAAGLLVFGPGQRPRVDAGSIEMRLIGAEADSSRPVSSQPRNP